MEIKKHLRWALLGIVALVLPVSQANAATPEVDLVSGSFPVSGIAMLGYGTLTTTSGATIQCTSGAGTGVATSKTTGEGSYTLSGCKASNILPCTTAGYSTGTIKLETLTLHLVYLDENHTKPGVLVTPPASGVFAEFTCTGIKVKITGNGILGELTAPQCGQTTNTASVWTQQVSQGVQKYQQVEETGTTYDLSATIGSEPPVTAAINSIIQTKAEREGTLTCPEQK
ncbi:MAG TPA: hypothetical protein VJU14_13795 [Solirubrobacterales bacterium]|nr:hypothetical protein [Solirubrobacterales bacterium]